MFANASKSVRSCVHNSSPSPNHDLGDYRSGTSTQRARRGGEGSGARRQERNREGEGGGRQGGD